MRLAVESPVEGRAAPTRQVRVLTSLTRRGGAAGAEAGFVGCWYAVEDADAVDFSVMKGEFFVVWVESMTGPTRNIDCAPSVLLLFSCTGMAIGAIGLAIDWGFRTDSGHEIAAGPTLHICTLDPEAFCWKFAGDGSEIVFRSESSRR